MDPDAYTTEVAGAAIHYHRGPGDAGILYLHGVPTSSDDWAGPLATAGGVAPDLPGFGRSSKATGLDYSLNGYATFVEGFLDAVGLTTVSLVAHGWGAAIGLLFAQRHPERVHRLVLIDAVPLLDGFRWPALARWWQRPLAGELLMGSIGRRQFRRLLRHGAATEQAWPDARIDAAWEQFDQGTQRAILRLHRSVDERGLAAAGAGLDRLSHPALVIWGEADPWLSPEFADAYAARLPAATVQRIPGAGHWPWLDQPELADRMAAFLEPGGA